MRSRYRVVDPEGIYFVTATIVNWIPVFISEPAFEIVTDSLTFCRREKGLFLYAYVIMDNHLHLMVKAPELSKVMQSFKKHTAARIIEHARATGKEWLLSQLAFYKKKYKDDSTYQVWQEGFHPQLIDTDAMLDQTIDYIHVNPVRRG